MAKTLWLAGAALGFTLCCYPALAAEKGTIGLSLDIAVEGGFFSPTLAKVTVNKLTAGGAAEKAGVLVGDEILKIADCAIPGCPADDAKDLMKKNKGESVSFLIKQADGTQLIKTVIAE